MSVPPHVPGPPPPPPFLPPPAGQPTVRPRGSRTKWIVGGVVAVVALCCGGSAIIAAVSPPPEKPAALSAPVSSAPTSSPAASPSASVAAVPPSAVASSPVPAATTAKPKPKPTVNYQKISARQWAKIARSPDDHAGEAYIVYGAVTQFDLSTGEDRFRGNVDGVRHTDWFDYDTNTILETDDPALIEDLANDDMFKAWVLVKGSYSYESTLGATLSTPLLDVRKIQRLSS